LIVHRHPVKVDPPSGLTLLDDVLWVGFTSNLDPLQARNALGLAERSRLGRSRRRIGSPSWSVSSSILRRAVDPGLHHPRNNDKFFDRDAFDRLPAKIAVTTVLVVEQRTSRMMRQRPTGLFEQMGPGRPAS